MWLLDCHMKMPSGPNLSSTIDCLDAGLWMKRTMRILQLHKIGCCLQLELRHLVI